jgi:hypothetical protein
MQTSSQGREFSALKNGWVVVLVALVVFISYENYTGLQMGRWPTVIVSGSAVLAGEVLCRMRPDRSVLETNLVLACITLALTIPALAIIQFLH